MEEFTYKDRYTFYKKDMWREMVVIDCIKTALEDAKKRGGDAIKIGESFVKLEAIEGFLKAMHIQAVLEDRMRAAARLLSQSLPTEIHSLDLDEEAEAKRIAEEKAFREQRNRDFEEAERKEKKKKTRK